MMALRAIAGHDERDIDRFGEPGIPLLAKSFRETSARAKIDARRALPEAIHRIDLITELIQCCDAAFSQRSGRFGLDRQPLTRAERQGNREKWSVKARSHWH